MGLIKDPEGIDFIIQSPPLIDTERKEISEFIRARKLDRLRTNSLDEMIDMHIGEVGTEKRESFEEELRLVVFSKPKTKIKRSIETSLGSRPKI